MTYKPKGSYSAAVFDSIRRAETMQAMVLDSIHGKFETEKPTKDIFSLTWEAFIEELEDAYANDTLEELNARYATLLQPFLEMAMAPPEQEAQ